MQRGVKYSEGKRLVGRETTDPEERNSLYARPFTAWPAARKQRRRLNPPVIAGHSKGRSWARG